MVFQRIVNGFSWTLVKQDIHRVLIEKGFNISFSSVCKYIQRRKAEKSKKPKDVFVKQYYEPGQECEFDWVRLHREKFGIPEHLIKWALDTIVTNGVRGERILSDEFFPDPKDVVFYEVAMPKEDAYLVTGNTKHFPKKPIVVTPAEMLEILQCEGVL